MTTCRLPLRRAAAGVSDRAATPLNSRRVNLLDARSGRVIRRYKAREHVWTSAVVDRRGDVYFATRRGDFYWFAPARPRLFRYDLPTTFDSHAALAGDGTLLVGANDGVLLAFGS